MKDMIASSASGFFGSFVLAWAIAVAVVSGVFRVFSRLYAAFDHHDPLPVSPGHTIKLPE